MSYEESVAEAQRNYHGFSRRGGVVIDTGPFRAAVPDHPPPFRYALENYWEIVVPAIRLLEEGATDREMWDVGSYDLDLTLSLARSFGCKCWKSNGRQKCDVLKARERAAKATRKSRNPRKTREAKPRDTAVMAAPKTVGWEPPRIPETVTARR